MPYLFATQDQDFSDYSSGRVLYSQPGAAAFPIRLASEIFQRARDLLRLEQPLALFDPTCGGAYALTALGFLYGAWIESITAADIDPDILGLAQRNLSLLEIAGLEKRRVEIERMLGEFGKESHAEALASIAILRRQLEASRHPIAVRTFQANALDRNELQKGQAGSRIDLVFCDIPYGNLSAWKGSGANSDKPPVHQLLDALLPLLPQHSIIAIAADKNQKITHLGYRRADHFSLGKRQMTFLAPASLS
jgi:23S rRNA (guanine2535-N1)-methyltransferase